MACSAPTCSAAPGTIRTRRSFATRTCGTPATCAAPSANCWTSAGTAFGQRARDWLEQAYETYQEAGARLEDAYREAARGSQPAGLDELGMRLAELDDIAYRFSVLMLAQLRDGTVGRRAPQPLGPPRPEPERD